MVSLPSKSTPPLVSTDRQAATPPMVAQVNIICMSRSAKLEKRYIKPYQGLVDDLQISKQNLFNIKQDKGGCCTIM